MGEIVNLEAAHKHSFGNRDEVMASSRCGCFYCLKVYSPAEIFDWIDEFNPAGCTAQCPRCGIDSVIGDASGIAIGEDFLRKMNQHFF